jgi:hypothetical protein
MRIHGSALPFLEIDVAILSEVPSFRFFANKYVNLFYHVCILFSEYFPDEYSLGILNNSAYRQQHEHSKTQSLHQKFQELWQYSYHTWDFVGKSLFKASTVAFVKDILEKESQDQAEIWLGILSEALPSYVNIWAQTEPGLDEYMSRFEAEWNLIREPILTDMSKLAKLPWKIESINVNLVDCVYGAESWVRDVVMPAFPVIDVEKKLLAHEIAHILVPDYFLKTRLKALGLDCAISHTLVDLIAYFGVKEHVTDPERKGIKPNPNYYAHVPELYPVFEDCFKNPDLCRDFDDILRRIKL